MRPDKTVPPRSLFTLPGVPLPESLQQCHLLVMEACEGGELFARVHSQQAGLSEAEAAPILMQANLLSNPAALQPLSRPPALQPLVGPLRYSPFVACCACPKAGLLVRSAP